MMISGIAVTVKFIQAILRTDPEIAVAILTDTGYQATRQFVWRIEMTNVCHTSHTEEKHGRQQ
jgi:hypothetical protein